jgi:hypothetical protein
MSHRMKLWERIIEHHLRGVTNITENQIGFMSERLTMEVIFLIRKLMRDVGSKRKTCISSLLTWRRPMTKCIEMLCGGLCRSTKSQQGTLRSLRICTIML